MASPCVLVSPAFHVRRSRSRSPRRSPVYDRYRRSNSRDRDWRPSPLTARAAFILQPPQLSETTLDPAPSPAQRCRTPLPLGRPPLIVSASSETGHEFCKRVAFSNVLVSLCT